MNILSLNISDLGGLSYNLCHAINKHTNHLARSVVIDRTFTCKPFMIRKVVGDDDFLEQLHQWVCEADVLHFNEKPSIISMYKIDPEICKDKKIIFHAHGTVFRQGKGVLLAIFRKAFPQMKVITSTPDLLEHAGGDATWFPSVIPVTEYCRRYRRKRNNPPIVYYSPTGSSSKKDRNVIQEVSREMWATGTKFELQVTRNTLHSENMRRKALADIYYDEILPSPFYGVNAIEAGALEKAVICNMTPYAQRYMKRLYEEEGIKCPFIVVATREPLKHILRRLVAYREYQIEVGEAGLEYVRKMHDEKVCIKRFMDLVES